MCTSYEANPNDALEVFSMFERPAFEYRREIYKDYIAPIFRSGTDGYTTDPASFGMVPHARIPAHVKKYDTMNARAESIAEKRSFSGAWKKLQLCLIPWTFFDPSYETGKAVRWKIGTSDGSPLCIAGLLREWEEEDGTSLSFTMLTLNANEHPLMKRFHKPDAEKRSVVIVPPAEYEGWLSSRPTDEAWTFLRLYPAAAMRGEPYPLPPRKPKAQDTDQPPLI